MDTGKLEKFAQSARRQLREQVAARTEQVLREDSAALREQADALAQLKEEIANSSKQAVIDRAAYTWFNRFVALRYMDVNFYNPVRVVSPQEGYSQPEILQDAKTGVMDDSLKVDKQRIMGLLNGEITSPNPQQEVYRLQLLGKCQQLHDDLPFLFPEIEDFTALLLPEDLLSENSILQAVRENLEQEDCKDVEVIGWLYQFYISEKKDEVIGSKKKIQPEDIPAATQLFTPHWIVRYLVENSLGRLWLLNYPDSNIRELMDYYIEPVEEDEEYLEVSSPEELKICDPACGSGHMLTYAFDLLYAIYEERGYTPSEIPSLILQKNLFGMEISERAGHLAAFALMMKAREKDSRFFEREVEPNICVFENIEFTDVELGQYMDAVGRDLFTGELEHALNQFDQAENFGSLIQPSLTNPEYIRGELNKRGIPQELFLHNTHKKVIQSLKYVSFLQPKYHVVVVNPPYMGGGNMNGELKTFGKAWYPNSNKDLFSMFIDRGLVLAKKKAYLSMITMQSWMFLKSFENLRIEILNNVVICTMGHLGARAFDTIGGEVVSTTAFIMQAISNQNLKGVYLRLVDGENEVEKEAMIRKAKHVSGKNQLGHYFHASGDDFKKIPGKPIAYWVSDKIAQAFYKGTPLDSIAEIRQGLATGDNRRYLRIWQEVNYKDIGFGNSSTSEAKASNKKWFPYNKGGEYKKWYGFTEYLVNWENDGEEIKNFDGSYIRNQDTYFKPSLSWSKVTSSHFSLRYYPEGYVFDVAGCSIFLKNPENNNLILGVMNSPVMRKTIGALSPTLNFEVGQISKFPLLHNNLKEIDTGGIDNLVSITKEDLESHPDSWGFRKLPLLRNCFTKTLLASVYKDLRGYQRDQMQLVKIIEEEYNQEFIRAYNLENELDWSVPVEEITLTSNPHYRYNGDKSEKELETLLLEDTMKEFVGYSVGCMFGRFSLDEPGLILANQGDATDTYLARIPDPTFMPDEDNVIPVLDEGWFSDDITERFKEFLRVTFGEVHFSENLDFVEKAIGRDIRSFFLKDFYDYHCKMYSKPFYGKRPIYWMFESPKGYFKALIYMHRYTKDTVSIVLNDYLREFRAKLQAQRTHLERQKDSGSKQEQARAIKELERMQEMLADLKEYEDDILYPLATQQIEIDLDDGVDVNYPKFGKALAPR